MLSSICSLRPPFDFGLLCQVHLWCRVVLFRFVSAPMRESSLVVYSSGFWAPRHQASYLPELPLPMAPCFRCCVLARCGSLNEVGSQAHSHQASLLQYCLRFPLAGQANNVVFHEFLRQQHPELLHVPGPIREFGISEGCSSRFRRQCSGGHRWNSGRRVLRAAGCLRRSEALGGSERQSAELDKISDGAQSGPTQRIGRTPDTYAQ